MSDGDGPDGLARAIVLTFDNLGEASALQRGTWNPQTPLGDDPSVTRALPWLLDALDDSGLRATFFVEAINCELNPEALRTISARGHELGVHGWEHEAWGGLDADGGARPASASHPRVRRAGAERARLSAARRRADRPHAGAAARAGIRVVLAGAGQRVGGIWSGSWSWRATASSRSRLTGSSSTPTTSWTGSPICASAAGTAPLRSEPRPPASGWRDHCATPRGPQTVIMHPFLMLDAAWRGQVKRLLERMAARGERRPGGRVRAQ